MDDKVIVLPNRKEMLERLLKVSDQSHLQKWFYPLLLKRAGEKSVVEDVVMMLALAIYDYTKNLSPLISGVLYQQTDFFVDALVDDAEMAQQAKDLFHE